MKLFFILLSIFTVSFSASAQKQSYFLFAAVQKEINLVCGEKVLIKSEEIQLTAAEASDYERKYEKELEGLYNSKTGYKNLQVKLIKQGSVVIQFEGERKYTQHPDQWNCTSNYYSIIVGLDSVSAERKWAAWKMENSKYIFEELKRWGKSALQSSTQDDLEVKWLQNQSGITVFIKNTGKNTAMQISINSYQKSKYSTVELKSLQNFTTLNKIEKEKFVLEPGSSAQFRFKNADAFEVETIKVKASPVESQPILNETKGLMRRYLNSGGTIKEYKKHIGTGVRG